MTATPDTSHVDGDLLAAVEVTVAQRERSEPRDWRPGE